MTLTYNKINLEETAEFIASHNKRIDLSADYIQEYILDMVKKDFAHVDKLALDDYVNGTMGFIYWIMRGGNGYTVDFYVNPNVSSNYDWTTL